jgi:hypothetical protein
MAKQMSFDTLIGMTCEESYWIPVQVNLNKVDKTGMVMFYGYANKAARDSAKQNIGQKSYTVNAAAFDKYFGPTAINPEGMNQFLAAYKLAEETLEGERCQDKVKDVDGNDTEELVPDTRVSFFAEATDV